MYRILRDLHLYFGLFISPFVLLFAVSVFFLNHGKVPGATGSARRSCDRLAIPAGIEGTQGADAIAPVRRVLDQCHVTGEIGIIRSQREARRVVITVWTPGRETTVLVDVPSQSAILSDRRMGIWETLGYLHKSPGPHLAAIRGNWIWTRAWRWLGDGTIYLLLFISATGVYLWLAIRAERRIGLALLAAGALSFFGTIHAVLR